MALDPTGQGHQAWGAGRMTDKAIIYADGASRRNPGPAAIGGVVLDESGHVIKEISQRIGDATNNVAEYKALIATLAAARDLRVRSLEIRLDSELIVRQITGAYRTKKPELKVLLKEAQGLLKGFEGYSIRHVPRSQNRLADALCNKALDRPGI